MAGFGAQKIKKGRKTPDTRTKRRNAVYNSVLSVRNRCPKGVRAGHLRHPGIAVGALFWMCAGVPGFGNTRNYS